jgi:hypothetical protein
MAKYRPNNGVYPKGHVKKPNNDGGLVYPAQLLQTNKLRPEDVPDTVVLVDALYYFSGWVKEIYSADGKVYRVTRAAHGNVDVGDLVLLKYIGRKPPDHYQWELVTQKES